ncbi:MAG TPA: GldG family protein [Caldilineae bacterium]|nr:GldG family protein [Caldilineae bacterium]
MMTTLRRAAPYFAGAGMVLILLALVAKVLSSDPEWLPGTLLGLGVMLIASYALLQPQQVATMLTGRQARYGGNALLLSVAFLGILATINILSHHHHKRFDLTESKQYTLSQETIQILRSLEKPVKVTGVFVPGDMRRTDVEDLLKEYAYYSDKFSYEFIDPEREPSKARRLGVTSYGVLVFQCEDRRQQTYGLDEEDLTSALLKVARPEQKVVYFTTGHKERDPQQFQPDGYGNIGRILGMDNYKVDLLNLATITETVPGDAAVIIVASPKIAFAPEEVALLDKWLEEGGRLMLLADPRPLEGGEDPWAPFADMLKKWGIRLRNDLVLDPASSFFGDAASPLVTRYRFSTITKDLGGLTTFFPLARSIEQVTPELPEEDLTITPLIETSGKSWGETNLAQRQVRYDEGTDVRGPLILAITVESRDRGSRLVVFGDADFASNEVLNSVHGAFGNADLFRNSVNWLAEEEALIAISPKPPDIRIMQPLTPAQQNMIFYGTVVFLPLLVLTLGGVVWWGRR